jgi:hypothetical protein
MAMGCCLETLTIVITYRLILVKSLAMGFSGNINQSYNVLTKTDKISGYVITMVNVSRQQPIARDFTSFSQYVITMVNVSRQQLIARDFTSFCQYVITMVNVSRQQPIARDVISISQYVITMVNVGCCLETLTIVITY